MRRLILLPIRYPRTTLALIAAITVWLAPHAVRIDFDASIESLLPGSDPDRVYYEQVKETFGSDEAGIIGVFAEDVFAPGTLAKVDQISTALSYLDGVREVMSLTTVQGVELDEFGAVSVGRLMKTLPRSRAEAEQLKNKISKNPLYAAHLVAPDDRSTGILVLFDNLSDEEYDASGIETSIRNIVDQAGGPEQYAVSGIHTLKVAAARLMKQDLHRFLPASIAAMVIILAATLRTIRGVLLPMTAVLIAVTWTIGLMELAHARINLGTLVLPPLLVAIGIAYVIHIMSRYYRRLGTEASGREALEAAVSEMALPIALAGLTTTVGFATLSFSSIRALQEFGRFALVGLLVVILMADAFVPAALVLFPEPRRGRGRYDRKHWVSRVLARCAHGAVRYRFAVLAVTAIICAIALCGAMRLKVETDYLTFIHSSHPVRQESKLVSDRLGGVQPLYFVLDGDRPKRITELAVLAAIRDLQTFINEQPTVDKTLSLIDYLSVVRSALNPDAPPGLPESQAEVSQLLLFVGAKELQPVATQDFARANIVVGMRLGTSAEISDLVEKVEAYAASRLPPEVHLHTSGIVALLNRSADVLVHGQVYGLCGVVAMLLVMMSVWLISLRAGAASLLPNLVPTMVMFGIMGWSGIRLSISTSMVAIIAIGIAINDAIHYLNSFNLHMRETGDEEQAIVRVAREVGLPIVLTSMVLVAGLAVVCLSNFTPIREFGLLTAMTMAGALVADLVILPALVRTAHLVTAWEILGTTLGSSPDREISLFVGLRPFQAKIVVLMGRVQKAEPGDSITREGERKDELYVLLDGAAQVRRAGTDNVIRTLRRGDVVGEMGVVRSQPRSANVTAVTSMEYLVLSTSTLTRLQRRHPRIAAMVFRNLTRILSDRLEVTSNELVQVSQGRA